MNHLDAHNDLMKASKLISFSKDFSILPTLKNFLFRVYKSLRVIRQRFFKKLQQLVL